jgi:hypothetical protein
MPISRRARGRYNLNPHDSPEIARRQGRLAVAKNTGAPINPFAHPADLCE